VLKKKKTMFASTDCEDDIGFNEHLKVRLVRRFEVLEPALPVVSSHKININCS
jgi:hypothetical protein